MCFAFPWEGVFVGYRFLDWWLLLGSFSLCCCCLETHCYFIDIPLREISIFYKDTSFKCGNSVCLHLSNWRFLYCYCYLLLLLLLLSLCTTNILTENNLVFFPVGNHGAPPSCESDWTPCSVGVQGSDAQTLPPLGHILECQDGCRGGGLRHPLPFFFH